MASPLLTPAAPAATSHEHPHRHTHDHPHTHPHDHTHPPDDTPPPGVLHHHPHAHEHTHPHAHPGEGSGHDDAGTDADHHATAPADGADHAHPHGAGHRVLEVHQAVLAANDRQAERNRGAFQALGILAVNVMSSPGSGKTELIRQTIGRLGSRLRCAVVVGDLETDNDARRLRAAGVPVVQITTGTLCHLDATMVARATGSLELRDLDLLFIENVGNLVCPAAFDLGEGLRVALLAVTEGEDKPLKYPPLFHAAHAALITKTDLAEATAFQRELALANLRRISHHAEVFEVSARTGAGLDAWCEFLIRRRAASRPAVV